MNNTPRNPPAYPTGDHKGMDLRDAFALAVIGDCVREYFDGVRNQKHPCYPQWSEGVAGDAYRIADAMLAEREKKED